MKCGFPVSFFELSKVTKKFVERFLTATLPDKLVRDFCSDVLLLGLRFHECESPVANLHC